MSRFAQLPEGGTTTVKSGKFDPFNQTKREAQTRWVLNPEAEGPAVVVDLTTNHFPESKCFSTSLTWGTVEKVERHPSDGPGVVSIYSWASDHQMLRVYDVPVARYSVKALEAHHAEALEAMVGQWGLFSMVFEEAAARNSLTESAN